MKKLNLIIVLLLLAIISYAQQDSDTGNITTLTKQIGTFYPSADGVSDGIWQIDEDPVPYVSLFEITSTVITHTTETNKSLYFIKKADHNEEFNRLEIDVVSDTGYSYFIIIDPDNNNIRALYKDAQGNLKMVRFVFKNTWVDN